MALVKISAPGHTTLYVNTRPSTAPTLTADEQAVLSHLGVIHEHLEALRRLMKRADYSRVTWQYAHDVLEHVSKAGNDLADMHGPSAPATTALTLPQQD